MKSLKLISIALAMLAGIVTLNAQTATVATNTFPPFSLSSLTNYTPTAASFAGKFDVRLGYGVNLNSRDLIAAMAASFSISPSLSFGGVVSHDSTGWCAGGVTLGINSSVNAPWIGELACFAGDGVAYDFKYHAPANYLFIGVERPFIVGKFRIAPAISLANTSTRAGTDLLLGVTFDF